MTHVAPPVPPRHAVALCTTDEELRVKVAPFVREGLASGDAVVAIVTSRTGKVLGEEFGSGAGLVRWGLPGLSYDHLGRATETLRNFLAKQRASGRATRVLTENDIDSYRPGLGRMTAYLRSEAAATGLLGSYGFPWLCLYDRRQYSEQVLADVLAVHPETVDDHGRPAGNPEYVTPGAFLVTHPGPLSPVPPGPTLDLSLIEVGDLTLARHRVGEAAAGLGLPEAETRAAEVASGEVIANAFRHGVLPGRVRVWRDAGVVFVRVDSGGNGAAVATAGFQPPDLSGETGAGLWVARHLADVVHAELRPDHTSLELQFPLP